jgi:hypothetical protein
MNSKEKPEAVKSFERFMDIIGLGKKVHPCSWGTIDFTSGEDVQYLRDIAAIRAFIPNSEMLTIFGVTPADHLSVAQLEYIQSVFPNVEVVCNADSPRAIALKTYNHLLSMENVSDEYITKGIEKTLRTFGASPYLIADITRDLENYKEYGILNRVFVKLSELCYPDSYGEYVAIPYSPLDTVDDMAFKLFYALGPVPTDMAPKTAWPTIMMLRYENSLLSTGKALLVPIDRIIELDLFDFDESTESVQKFVKNAKAFIVDTLMNGDFNDMVHDVTL